jgi:hypothetical protein
MKFAIAIRRTRHVTEEAEVIIDCAGEDAANTIAGNLATYAAMGIHENLTWLTAGSGNDSFVDGYRVDAVKPADEIPF